MSEMYQLKREINRLRENINKRDQNAGENNLHQEYTIKNYYLEQQNSFLKQELSLKQNTTDKYFWKSVQVNIKILVTLKKKVRKPSMLQKRKVPVANS